MDRVAAEGNFASWEGGCIFIGSSVRVVPMHAHYAIQLACGSEHGLRFSGDGEEWKESDGALIASRQPHSMDATRVQYNVVLFVEPETHQGRVLAERYLEHGITSMPDEALPPARALLEHWARTRSVDGLKELAWRVIETLTGQHPDVAAFG